MELLCITDAVKRFGVSSKTLRYYESVGLLQSIRGNDNKYRYYDPATVERIRQILVLRKMQIPIRDILRIYASEDMRTVVEVFVDRIDAIEEEIGTLSELKRVVNEFLETMIKSGITKISALPLLYEEMDRKLESYQYQSREEREPEKSKTDFASLSAVSEKLIPEPDIRILLLPESEILTSCRKSDGHSDPDEFWKWLNEHSVDCGTPGSHTLFEQQGSADDVPILLLFQQDHRTDEDSCPYRSRLFHGGLFAAASVCTDEDLSHFLCRMTAMLTENKYYELDYNKEGNLREDLFTETVISPDELREKIEIFLPVKKRVANAAYYKGHPQEFLAITAEELLRENPTAARIPVDLSAMSFTGMRKLGDNETFDYKFFDFNERGQIELHSYLLPRRLITAECVRIPCRIDLHGTVYNENMEVELLYHRGGLRIHFGADTLQITVRDPVFGDESVFSRTLPQTFRYGGDITLQWFLGERHFALAMNGEVVFCLTAMTYMQIDRNTFLPHPFKVSAANGFDHITVKSMDLYSILPKKKSNIKKGELQMIIRPSNNMLAGTHPLCTWHFGENYPFNACMRHLMEYVEPDPLYTYNFFAGISGDDFVQVYGHDYASYSDCISVVWNGAEFVKNVFDQIGYSCTYVTADQIAGNKTMYIETLKAYIDRGIPVLKRDTMPGSDAGNYDLFVGYEENGKILLYLNGDTPEPFKMNTDEAFHQDWIFIGSKTVEPDIVQIYKNAFANIAALLTSPDRFRCSFGPNAFRAWADDIVNGRFDNVKPEEFDQWRDYTIYVCNFSTNFCGNAFDFLNKAVESVPSFAPALEEYRRMEQKSASEILPKLEELGGNFNATLENLQDVEKRAAIAEEIRKYADLYDGFVRVLNTLIE